MLTISDEAMDALVAALLPVLAEILFDERGATASEGYLNAARAAEYLGVSRKRIYDLKSIGALVPDGYDGRTPLWSKASLDVYVRRGRGVRALPSRLPSPS